MQRWPGGEAQNPSLHMEGGESYYDIGYHSGSAKHCAYFVPFRYAELCRCTMLIPILIYSLVLQNISNPELIIICSPYEMVPYITGAGID